MANFQEKSKQLFYQFAVIFKWLIRTKEGCFLTEKVMMPIILGIIVFLAGQYFQSKYQDWSAKKDQAREVAIQLRSTANSLAVDIETLLIEGGGIEKVGSARSTTSLFTKPLIGLTLLEGVARALSKFNLTTKQHKTLNDLPQKASDCRVAINNYNNELGVSLNEKKSNGNTNTLATNNFKEKRKVCDETIYSALSIAF